MFGIQIIHLFHLHFDNKYLKIHFNSLLVFWNTKHST